LTRMQNFTPACHRPSIIDNDVTTRGKLEYLRC
jgi:hypothetical protein